MKILQRRKDKQATVPKAEVEKVNIQPTTKANKNDNRSVRSKLGRSKKKGEKVVEDDDATWWPKATDEDDAATQCSSSTAATKDRKGQKQVLYTHFGGFPKDVLEVTMDPKPKVEHPTDVVVKVEASSVTLNDCLLRRGICFHVWDPVCLPATPGADVVGTIEEMGDDVPVDSWSIGNRVAALVRTGGNARYIVVPYTSLVHVPKSLDAAQAVSMVSTYMTAYQSLKLTLNSEEKKGAKPFAGKKILVVGGGSPVGEALIQLSLKAGATEVYATGQQKLSKFLKGLGATPLGYESEEWLPPVKGKMDLVFDGVCQDGYDSSQLALQDHGKLVTVGMVGKLQSEGPGLLGAPLSAFITDAKASLFMSKTQTYDAWASFQHDPETYKADMEKLFNKVKKNQIRPGIARRVGLDNVADAHMFLERDKARGLIVCLPWKRGIRTLKEEDHMDPEETASKKAAQKKKKGEKDMVEEDRQDAVKPKRERRGLFGGRDKAEKRQDKGKTEQEN